MRIKLMIFDGGEVLYTYKKLGIKTISYRGHGSGDFRIQKFGKILGILEKLDMNYDHLPQF